MSVLTLAIFQAERLGARQVDPEHVGVRLAAAR
jgi:hypothetical protein